MSQLDMEPRIHLTVYSVHFRAPMQVLEIAILWMMDNLGLFRNSWQREGGAHGLGFHFRNVTGIWHRYSPCQVGRLQFGVCRVYVSMAKAQLDEGSDSWCDSGIACYAQGVGFKIMYDLLLTAI